MGRNPRKNRTSKKGKIGRRQPRNAGNGQDWSENLEGAWRLLELLPVVGQVVSHFQEDPVEQHLDDISNTLEQLAPHLSNYGDNVRGLINLLKPAVGEISQQTDLLEEIRDLLISFHAPNVFGQYAAISLLTEAVADIKRLADAAEKMAASMEAIEQNLLSVNLGGDHFPGRVHSWLRLAIEDTAGDDVPHYFTTFNLGNTWWPKFRDIDRDNPLGPRYLGHKTDLDELCAFLADEARPRVGPHAVLHVFVLTLRQMAMKEAVDLPKAMHPCVFNGERADSGVPFVYICFTEDRDKACLRDIGVLSPRQIWVQYRAAGACVPVLHRWFAHRFEPIYYIDPGGRTVWQVDVLVYSSLYAPCGFEPPRTLGRPVEPGTRPWYR